MTKLRHFVTLDKIIRILNWMKKKKKTKIERKKLSTKV